MKRTVWLWQLFGFAVTTLGGTLLHFVYEWTNSLWAAPFSGVNESTWEHMKLLFWPMLIFAIFESFFFKDYEHFWCVKLKGMLLGLGSVPLIFYMYNGIIGKSPDWVNISIFFISAAISYIYETKRLNDENTSCNSPRVSLILIFFIALCFVVFTFVTPGIELFRDPLTNTYGI